MDKRPAMVTQAEAEVLARAAIQKYLNDCNLQTTDDAGNALMKLVSVAGVTMAAVAGGAEAVARLEATAAFIDAKFGTLPPQAPKVVQ